MTKNKNKTIEVRDMILFAAFLSMLINLIAIMASNL